ncbi:hypothetical protein HELRODRAFT_158456 [Helobdella robusta]|uniref:Uncharacterized protein n=1 Tax=Helobdella robusta TaxID=6412 RepID=T1EMT3_HELRO|nr:hypothetical protein HELRODRAFT_158456 [Helobdella robusta]ESO12048.1 hypothetical protein HELRODRAFT_158456 [Helobdella robusta]
MEVTEDIGYYQILDNYTIWRLETVVDSDEASATLLTSQNYLNIQPQLFPPSSPAESSPNISYEIPLHKKRNLIKNLETLIKDMQQKVSRIKAEIPDNTKFNKFVLELLVIR